MLRMSPKGTVPVLVRPGGQVIDESLDIMRWAFDGRDSAGWWQRAQSPSCQAFIARNDRQLARQPFLGGAEPCAADLAIFPFVRQFRAVDERWFDAQALHATQRWLRGWLESELFQRCMKKLTVGSTLKF